MVTPGQKDSLESLRLFGERHHSASRLTQHQIKILSLIARGKKSNEVAEKMGISKRTVDFHLTLICLELKVNSEKRATRQKMIRTAREMGFLPFEAPEKNFPLAL